MSANKVTVSPTTNTITVSSPGTVGPQGGTGAAGTNGTNGTNGTDGTSALVGLAAPTANLGDNGDVYFDNQNYDLYEKVNGAWVNRGSYATTVGNYTFSTIAVAGQNNVVADSATDTLTLAAGNNVTLTTNDSTDTITVASTDTTANETITLSGDVTGSGTTGISATLANSGVSAGTYGSASLIPSITVDAKGRVTGVTTSGISSSAGGTVSSVAVSGSDGIEVDSGSPITSSGTIALGVNASSLRTHLNIEDGADVTDAANVASAGAVMDTDFSSNGLMKRTGAGTYTVDANTYITDIVSDTTPQLGGDLQTNSNDILSAHNSTDVIADSTAHFTVTAAGGYYSIDGVQQATLKLERNKSYVFDVADYSSHPFYFQTTDNGGAYDSGNVVSYQSGNTTRTVILRIPNSAPDTLYYRCSQHSGMGGSVSLRPTLATVATSGSYNDLSNVPTANQIIDWTSSGAGTIHSTNIPAIALSSIQTAASESAQLALTTQEGDVVVRTDQNRTYMKNSGTAGSMADFTQILTPTDYVSSSSGGTFSGNVNFTGNVTQNNASLATTGKAIAMAMVFG